MNLLLDGTKITIGTCYYPEHWPQNMWQDDLERMKKTGIEVIRIGEFSWNLTEPVEGTYVYDFFDDFLELCNKIGMKVIFCTPTATPPAWLTEKYPEVLNAKRDGSLVYHGERCHVNHSSRIFRQKTELITEHLAAHFASHPCIIGWQIDNEINCETDEFYSESDDLAFREWVIKKYINLDALNEAWGTRFWNQTYSSFSEVHIPRQTNHNVGNPHQNLDYRRFVSDCARSYIKLQSDIIRKYLKEGDFITTNGMFNLDNHKMNKESLDFYTYDSYPNFAYDEFYDQRGERDLLDRWWSRNLTEVRSISEPFGIMEQQSGAGGWTTRMRMPTPRPGQIRLWTMQSISHGAEYVSYFRWRTSTIGTEIYWHGILDYSNRENRRLREVRNICDEVKKLSRVCNSKYEAKVAVLRTWDNQWDAQCDKWHSELEEISQKGIFAAATRTHTPIDYIYLGKGTSDEDLEKYDLLIFPHAVVVTQMEAMMLERYVKNGGRLLLGCRAGLKTSEGHITMDDLPGVFKDMAGCIVAEFTPEAPDEENIYVVKQGDSNQKFRLSAKGFFDQLQVTSNTAEVKGVYDSTYIKDEPALIRNIYGLGKVYSFGSTFTEDTAAGLFKMLGVCSPYEYLIELPKECELAVRTDGAKKWLFVLNFDKSDVILNLKKEMQDILNGGSAYGSYELKGYDVAVFEI
ncbi:MAG: beta-galactosidase [Butyrivibrio sp.]|uniref:beta-galactosidase n=1 Tax=Butyrivibrio sp. TaxID=28121 RepID=UPI0025F6565F|nr:beta-galactosidase [Butyrivibrio sp.]MCR5773074.1 beta-galactosidase [Butyrivibrio sp.]